MTRLLLDLGNTRLKWRLQEDTVVVEEGAWAHDDVMFAARLETLGAASAGAQGWLASVALPATTGRVSRGLSAHLLAPLQQVQVTPSLGGPHLAYAEPGQLGVDRWLAMLGAMHTHAGPYVVALAGSALTLDAVDGASVHLGGVIAPGLAIQHRALTCGPLYLADAGEITPTLLANNTSAAVASGPLWALAALIERFVAAATVRCGTAPVVLLSGGDAKRLQPLIRMSTEWCPHLVLEGLAWVVDHQQTT